MPSVSFKFISSIQNPVAAISHANIAESSVARQTQNSKSMRTDKPRYRRSGPKSARVANMTDSMDDGKDETDNAYLIDSSVGIAMLSPSQVQWISRCRIIA